MTRCLLPLLLFALPANPLLALLTGPGPNFLGCHHDRKPRVYHCHMPSVAGQTFASKAEEFKRV